MFFGRALKNGPSSMQQQGASYGICQVKRNIIMNCKSVRLAQARRSQQCTISIAQNLTSEGSANAAADLTHFLIVGLEHTQIITHKHIQGRRLTPRRKRPRFDVAILKTNLFLQMANGLFSDPLTYSRQLRTYIARHSGVYLKKMEAHSSLKISPENILRGCSGGNLSSVTCI